MTTYKNKRETVLGPVKVNWCFFVFVFFLGGGGHVSLSPDPHVNSVATKLCLGSLKLSLGPFLKRFLVLRLNKYLIEVLIIPFNKISCN